MIIGTRVTHRRYGWMIGHTVQKVSDGLHIMVLWDGKGGPIAELPHELRATPVQVAA